MPEIPEEAVKVLQQIVFDTPIARHVEDETPATIVSAVRNRIWDNIHAYAVAGDWPDRPRTLEEIEQEYRDWDEDKLRAELARQAFAAGRARAEPEPATKPRRRKTGA